MLRFGVRLIPFSCAVYAVLCSVAAVFSNIKQGVHPKVVQERLGHSQINLTPDT
jgi:hypothetical protein